MRTITFLLSIMLLVIACKSKKAAEEEKTQKATTLPPAATSAEAVKKWITNKDLVTVKAGLNAPGTGSSYEWVESSDTSAFAKEFLEKEMSFELHLNYDSTGVFYYGKLPSWDSTGKSIYIPDLSGMTYKVEDGVLLNVFVTRRNSFDGSMEQLGSTYKVLGADDKSILLLAPRSYLDKDVVLLLSIKQNQAKLKN